MAEFDLHITFAGLCLLVDDTGGAKKRVHVLMPRTTGSHFHAARLKFNRGHRTGMGELPSPGASIELENRKLDLSGLDTRTPLVLNLRQSNVFDLGDFAAAGVDRVLLDRGDGTTLPNQSVARVTLAAGKIKLRKKGARWRMGQSGRPVHMATSVQVRIEKVQGSSLTLNLEPLNQDGAGGSVTLRPIAGVIKLWVYHSPPREIPEEIPPLRRAARPPSDRHAHHVAALYDLLTPRREPVVPEYVDVRDSDTDDTEPDATEVVVGVASAAAEDDSPSGRGRGAALDWPGLDRERPELTAEEAEFQSGELVSCILMSAKPA